MELSRNVVDNLKDIRVNYEKQNKLFDAEFIEYAIKTIAQEEYFDGILHASIYMEGKGTPAFVTSEGIHIVMNGLYKLCLKTAKERIPDGDPESLILVANLYALYSVLHEFSHVYYLFGLSDNPDLNTAYKEIYEKMKHMNLIQRFIYHFYAGRFSFERDAILEGMKITAQIYDDSEHRRIPEFGYIMSLVQNLEKRVSPMDFTLRVLRLKNVYDFSSLTPLEALEHGIEVDEPTLIGLAWTVERYRRDMISYDEGLKELKLMK